MGDGGIQECGYAQNCVEACPKDIPLTKAISKVGGDVMVRRRVGILSAGRDIGTTDLQRRDVAWPFLDYFLRETKRLSTKWCLFCRG